MTLDHNVQVDGADLGEPQGPSVVQGGRRNATINQLEERDRPIHGWYRFVLSFPPHLVRQYASSFGLSSGSVMLDPFCGTGTAVVEAKKLGLRGIGIEANDIAHLAATVKTDWSVAPAALRTAAHECASEARRLQNAARRLRSLPPGQMKLLLENSICPVPLHKALILRDTIRSVVPHEMHGHAMLALAATAVSDASNLHFGPEVGVRGRREDADVVGAWLARSLRMADELEKAPQPSFPAVVHHGDSRDAASMIKHSSVDAVFTSPPYPNEKDYTRTTRLESVLLECVTDKETLRVLKKGLLRSNTRGVYKGDHDDHWIATFEPVQRLAAEIEQRRLDLGKTSGFERMYHRVTKLYFGGMARHFADLRAVLKPGAMLGYVVGDQASYLQVMIRTGELLGQIAEQLGYEVLSLDLFRTRIATATRAQMREETLVLRWPGPSRG